MFKDEKMPCRCNRPVPVTPHPPQVECVICGGSLPERQDIFLLANSTASKYADRHRGGWLSKKTPGKYRLLWDIAFRNEIFYCLITQPHVKGEDDINALKKWDSILSQTFSEFSRRVEAEKEREKKKLKIRECYQLFVNQGMREAICLAVLGDEALIEYEMPRGSTTLRVVDACSGQGYKTVSYRAIPKKWQKAMEDACTDILMRANPQ
jgi:hypothetical protein